MSFYRHSPSLAPVTGTGEGRELGAVAGPLIIHDLPLALSPIMKLLYATVGLGSSVLVAYTSVTDDRVGLGRVEAETRNEPGTGPEFGVCFGFPLHPQWITLGRLC